jgi:ubiquinone/menaquinone biosynthesis C-methylase UbiE
VVGVDLSTGMLFKARHKLSGEELANKTELLLADAERLPFRSSAFDAVTSSGVVRFLPKAEEAFLEWNVAMKPGGNLAIREMAVTIPRLVRHIPLPFMHSFVVWRLRTDGEMVEMLGRAGYAGVTAFRAGVVPHFIIAMGSPFRRYVFLVASKPSAELDPMSEEAGARTALLKGLPFATT